MDARFPALAPPEPVVAIARQMPAPSLPFGEWLVFGGFLIVLILA